MALNPFEQLEFFVSEPKRAFGEVLGMILRERFGPAAECRPGADGDVRLRETLSEGGVRTTVYHPRYYIKRWRNSQRQQVREAFQATAAAEGAALARWVLCVPTELAKEDLRWFTQWRAPLPVEVDVLDGNGLVQLLEEPCGRQAVERIRAWGVMVSGPESARVRGMLKVAPADPKSGLTHYLYVSVRNTGGHLARDLRVEVAHTKTNHLTFRQDERDWRDEGSPELGSRLYRACQPLTAGEERLLLVIPIGLGTPLPVQIRLKVSVRETLGVEQHLCVDARSLASGNRLDFIAGPGRELVPVGPLPVREAPVAA